MRLVLRDPGDNPADDLAGVLARARVGDGDAWRELVALYARRVYALVRSRCSDPELSEEITQNVFATMSMKLNDRYAEEGKFEAWLFRIAMNKVRDEMRRVSRHARTQEPARFDEQAAGVEPRAAEGQTLAALRDAMARLGASEREVVELRHHGQMSFRQIADLLGEPMGTLLARHHRALRKLRDMMEADEGQKRGTA